MRPAATEGQNTAGILSMEMLKQLLLLISKFNQTGRNNQTDHLVNRVVGAL